VPISRLVARKCSHRFYAPTQIFCFFYLTAGCRAISSVLSHFIAYGGLAGQIVLVKNVGAELCPSLNRFGVFW
jgi:hypothetical protein